MLTFYCKQDIHAFDSTGPSSSVVGLEDTESEVGSSVCGTIKVAVPTIDTVTHDMSVTPNGSTVQLFDGCVNINDVRNGILCSMHPSEVSVNEWR